VGVSAQEKAALTWPQFATAVLGVVSMIAGGFLMHTEAGAPLIAAGGTLVGIAIPWPQRVRPE